MNALVIDAFEFCRLKERREGQFAVPDLSRLAEESVDQSGEVRWALQGEINKHGHAQLALSVFGSVKLMCQRCLVPFPFEIVSDSLLVLAADEGNADELDKFLADEEVEVVVASRSFDVVRLVEDEALLALPFSPRHEVCPDRGVPEVGEGVEKVSPFAVLKDLKR
jgi:uncharacterized protein